MFQGTQAQSSPLKTK